MFLSALQYIDASFLHSVVKPLSTSLPEPTRSRSSECCLATVQRWMRAPTRTRRLCTSLLASVTPRSSSSCSTTGRRPTLRPATSTPHCTSRLARGRRMLPKFCWTTVLRSPWQPRYKLTFHVFITCDSLPCPKYNYSTLWLLHSFHILLESLAIILSYRNFVILGLQILNNNMQRKIPFIL